MSLQRNHKLVRDTALFRHWEGLAASAFDPIPLPQLKAAQAALQGHIVLPGDPDYNADRQLFNPVFNAYPVAIVYCAVESDVAIALKLAQDVVLPFTVRSGGHCTAGFSAGYGVLIDVSALNEATIDTVAQVATVGTGCPFSKLDLALDQAGLHVPGGECQDVCIGGYLQGGGYGFTSVTFGMNCDNVIDMRVMLADGRVVTASPAANTDLWWAMRGGTGGNFGVLLSVRYQLRPLGDVFGWALIWPLQSAGDFANATGALMALQSGYMLANLPQALNIQVSLCYQPGTQPGLPLEPQQPYLMVRGLYVGSQADGQAAIQPLCALPGAIVQWTAMDSYYNLNKALLDQPYGMPCLPPDSPMPCEDKASRYVTRPLAAAEWLGLLQYFVTAPNELTYFYMEFYGGAINAVQPQANAFVHRSSAFNAVLDVFWFDDAHKQASQDFLLGWMNLMAPMWNGEIYQNYPRPDQPGYGAAYWADAQAGLYAVKLKYDPTHAFRFAQEVGPLMPPGGGIGPVIELPAWLQQWLQQPIVVDARWTASQLQPYQ
ncbi:MULTISPECIES: FAD-dependent oxidoreductase [unclassified Rhizobacter]|uniref:FAD-dependent oxidoreductase n=1 Tax=unclassified Rhizobacter TaxID=2640088 RepID=UPI0009E7E817|nr:MULTISPECIES: FAD-dependent oxidoreductase [unclassified Rhizobacter]